MESKSPCTLSSVLLFIMIHIKMEYKHNFTHSITPDSITIPRWFGLALLVFLDAKQTTRHFYTSNSSFEMKPRTVLCCASDPARVITPEPPSRPRTTGLGDLLTVSCLPDDHPGAVRFPEKKPSVDFSIVRSPSMTDKLKTHLKTRSSHSSLSSSTHETANKQRDVSGSDLSPLPENTEDERSIPRAFGTLPRDNSRYTLPIARPSDATESVDDHQPVELDGLLDGAADVPIPPPRRSNSHRTVIPRLQEMRISQLLRPLSGFTDRTVERSTLISPSPSSLYSRYPSRAEWLDGSTDERMLSEYERRLTIAGDDRRRPSAINLNNLQELEKDDAPSRNPLKRRISRAKPLADNAGELMAEALAAHKEEKASFRSASKQRESLAAEEGLVPPPIFATSIFAPSSHALESSSEEEGPPANSTFLHVPGDLEAGAASFTSTKSSHRRRKASSAVAPSIIAPSKPKRIGTWLDSWTKFPSHTRPGRCGSAGPADHVVMHDFEPARTEQVTTERGEGDQPTKRSSKVKPPGKMAGIWKYYAEVLTTGSVQNRRSSVSAGGWLEQPDLELLPPRQDDYTSSSASSDGGRGGSNGNVYDEPAKGQKETV